MPSSRLVVSVCGPTCSGKSTLARAVAARLGVDLAARVPADWYLLDGEPGGAGTGYRWDWPLLARDLAGPGGATVTTPPFDFAAMRRDEREGSAMTFTLRPVMLVDAMRSYPGAGLVAWLEVPPADRLARLRERDRLWGSDVTARWASLESAMGVPPAGVDVVLDGRRPLEELAQTLARRILLRVRQGEPGGTSAAAGGPGLDP